VQAFLDRSNRDAERRGRLIVRQSFEIEEHHGAALPWRQSLDSSSYTPRQVKLLCSRGGVDSEGIHRLVHLLAAEQAVQQEARSTPSAQPSAANIQTDTSQPRAELRRFPQTAQSEKGLQQRLLRRIGGQAGVAKAALAENHQRTLMAGR
jgi:hypothetical protein